ASDRVYRTRTRHCVIGSDWRSLRRSRWSRDPLVYRPWYASRPVVQSEARPGSGAPFFVSFQDGAVKGCRRNGATVELFAVELKDFTDFVLGKLRATLQFENEAVAESFARHYPVILDLGGLESAVKVEIDRSRRIRVPKRPTGV